MAFQMLNDKKMFASFESSIIMTVHAWKSLKDKVREHKSDLTDKE